MRHWPDKKKERQKQRDQERAEEQLQEIVSRMSDEALDLFSALYTLDAWNNPMYARLVERVDREMSAAVSASGDLGSRRVRPRLPLWTSSNVSASERDRAHRTLMKALGHDLPEDESEPEALGEEVYKGCGLEAPTPKRTVAQLHQKLRSQRRESAAAPQKPEQRNCGSERPRRRPRLRTQPARPAATPQARPARVETDPQKNPWLYDEALWQ